jgi:hypothetical protein
MYKKLFSLVTGITLLMSTGSIFLNDTPPAIAKHTNTKNGSWVGNRDKHQSGPQAGLREGKRKSPKWIQRVGKKLLGNPARRNSKTTAQKTAK